MCFSPAPFFTDGAQSPGQQHLPTPQKPQPQAEMYVPISQTPSPRSPAKSETYPGRIRDLSSSAPGPFFLEPRPPTAALLCAQLPCGGHTMPDRMKYKSSSGGGWRVEVVATFVFGFPLATVLWRA